MNKRSLHVGIFVFLLLGSAAVAQNNRSAVSLNGSDLNACTTTSPCRSFATALSQTNAGGEIIALDSAGYGPFTIDRAIAVSGAPGVHAAISVPLNYGISVAAAPTDRIVIRNLVFIGTGGLYGVDVSTAAETRVLDCFVRGFATAGIRIQVGNAIIDHTTAIDNIGTTGIALGNENSTAFTVLASITNCLIDNNYNGIVVRAKTRAVLRNSTITNNGYGALAISTIGNPQIELIIAELTIENCTIAHNSQGIYTFGSGGNNAGSIWMSQNVIAYNANAVQIAGHSFVYSFANNSFVGNGTDGGPFLPSVSE